jgi:hypothetical protein
MRTVLLLAVWMLSHAVHLLASTWLLLASLTGRQRAWDIALGYDHLGNAVTGGSASETISSRAYRAMQEKRTWGCVLCRLLDLLEKNHCQKAARKTE